MHKDGNQKKVRRAAILVLSLAGAGLIVLGLQQPRETEPSGWVEVNEVLAEAMTGKEASEGGAGKKEGGGKEAGIGGKGVGADGGSGLGGIGSGAGDGSGLGGNGSGAGDGSGLGGNGGKAAGDKGAAGEQEAGGTAVADEGQSVVGVDGKAVEAGSQGAVGAGGEPGLVGVKGEAGGGGSVAAGSGASGGGQGAGAGNAADGRLDMNRATAEQLDTLPGVGPAKAKAIVEERNRSGFFRSIDDVQRVKGIGPKIVEKWKDLVVALP